jgi:hypothetical protein
VHFFSAWIVAFSGNKCKTLQMLHKAPSMNVYGELKIELHSFLTSVLDSVSDHLQESAALLRRQNFRYPFDKRLEVLQSQSEGLGEN